MNLNEPRSKFVTDNTRVTTCKSNAGLREVLELSKRLNSGPKHADVRPHINSHIFTHDNGNSPGTWFVSFGLFGNGINVIVKDTSGLLKEHYPPTVRDRKLYEIEHELHSSKHPDTLVYFLPIANLLGGLVKKLSKKTFSPAGKFNSMNTYSEGLPKNDFNEALK